jgi:glutamine synthetase
MTSDMRTVDGAPWEACPRAFLKRQIAACLAAGFTVRAAFECEFTLAVKQPDGGVAPLDESLCFSTIGMTTAAPVMDEIVAALEAQRIPVEQYYPELGHGQQELSIGHAPALEAADRQVFYRETVRGVAHRHGLWASLAPKPFVDQAGNGAHIHFSLWDTAGRRTRMHDPRGRYGVSALGYHFIAGVLEHLPALLALTCPSVNSYRRLQPHFWSSAYTAWGPDNREAAVRVASTFPSDRAGFTNAELKASDSSSNPYLALGGLLAAGLDGVARTLAPGEPVLVDPGTLSESERRERGIRRYPTTLGGALDRLEADGVLMAALGPTLARAYLAVKRSEAEAFGRESAAFETKHHFWKF